MSTSVSESPRYIVRVRVFLVVSSRFSVCITKIGFGHDKGPIDTSEVVRPLPLLGLPEQLHGHPLTTSPVPILLTSHSFFLVPFLQLHTVFVPFDNLRPNLNHPHQRRWEVSSYRTSDRSVHLKLLLLYSLHELREFLLNTEDRPRCYNE